MQCISRHLQLTIVESPLCCPCLEPLFSLGSQTAFTQCTFITLPGVIVPGTCSQPSYTASSEQAPIHFTAENSISGTGMYKVHNMSLSSLQMPKIELHRPGIEPGPPALQAGTLPKELSTLKEKLTENSAMYTLRPSTGTLCINYDPILLTGGAVCKGATPSVEQPGGRGFKPRLRSLLD
jgi:hypothetical protein